MAGVTFPAASAPSKRTSNWAISDESDPAEETITGFMKQIGAGRLSHAGIKFNPKLPEKALASSQFLVALVSRRIEQATHPCSDSVQVERLN